MNFRLIFVLAGLSALLSSSYAEEFVDPGEPSHPDLAVEPLYAEAILEFNNKNNAKALQLLDAVLKLDPKNIHARELKALTLKSAGSDASSIEAYKELIRLKPDQETGPYYFEIGSIYFKHKKYKEAQYYLAHSIRRDFNVSASYFMIGIADMQSENSSRAEQFFLRSKSLGPEEISLASRYYLGILYIKSQRGPEGIQELVYARDESERLKESAIGKEIYKGTSAILDVYDKSQWFGSVTLLSQYDGNVSVLPDATTSATEAQGKTTLKAVFVGNVGYSSSPLRTFQWVGSYRAVYNKNFNSKSRAYEYFSNIPTMYLIRGPLFKTSYGLKLEANYTFKNTQRTTNTESYIYKPYSLTGDLGPFVRHITRLGFRWTLEASFRPSKYYQDLSSGPTRRSGAGWFAKWSISRTLPSRWWNPTGYLSFEKVNAAGEDYRETSFGVGASNSMRLTEKDTVNAGIELEFSKFAEYTPSRSDQLLTLRASWVRSINARLSLLGDITYLASSSNVPELFQYKKPSVSLGLSYAF